MPEGLRINTEQWVVEVGGVMRAVEVGGVMVFGVKCTLLGPDICPCFHRGEVSTLNN